MSKENNQLMIISSMYEQVDAQTIKILRIYAYNGSVIRNFLNLRLS